MISDAMARVLLDARAKDLSEEAQLARDFASTFDDFRSCWYELAERGFLVRERGSHAFRITLAGRIALSRWMDAQNGAERVGGRDDERRA